MVVPVAVASSTVSGAVGGGVTLAVGERGHPLLLLVVPRVFPHALLAAEHHPARMALTVVVVLVQVLAARLARVVSRVPEITTQR